MQSKEDKQKQRRIHYQKNKDMLSEKARIYYQKNKERIDIKAKLWRENNKDWVSERRRIYVKKNKEKLSIQQQEYRKNNKDMIGKNKKMYRSKNKEKLAMDYKIWYEKNKERKHQIFRRKKHYEKNKELLKEKKRIWYEKNKNHLKQYRISRRKINAKQEMDRYNFDSQYRLRNLLRNRLYICFRDFSKNGKVNSSNKYGINFELILNYIGPMPNDGEKYHIDHIVPLCSFDFDDIEQIKLAFAPENHQWLIAEENMKKGSKIL